MQAAVVHLARQRPGLSLCTIPGTCSQQGVRFTKVSVGNNLGPALARTVWIISVCLEKLHCFTALLSRWRCLPGFRLRFGQAGIHQHIPKSRARLREVIAGLSVSRVSSDRLLVDGELLLKTIQRGICIFVPSLVIAVILICERKKVTVVSIGRVRSDKRLPQLERLAIRRNGSGKVAAKKGRSSRVDVASHDKTGNQNLSSRFYVSARRNVGKDSSRRLKGQVLNVGVYGREIVLGPGWRELEDYVQSGPDI